MNGMPYFIKDVQMNAMSVNLQIFRRTNFLLLTRTLMHQSIETPTPQVPGKGRGFDIDPGQKAAGPPPLFQQFRIGVSINQGSQTLTLFKIRKLRFDTLLKAHTSYKGPFKMALLNLKTCIQACSTVLINRIFFILCIGISKDHNTKKDTLSTSKTLPYWAAHTYIAYIKRVLPPLPPPPPLPQGAGS